MCPYPRLFTPITLGSLHLPNRILMGAMHTGLEDAHDGFRKLAAFYQARAQGGASLIVTGGFSPDLRGRLHPFSGQLSHRWVLGSHRRVTDSVHQADSKIVLQLLHSGRYGFHPFIVSASNKRSPISRFTPKALTSAQIHRLVDDFAHSAFLAKEAGYDGVEIMGSEGYLLHQFLSFRTNDRTDQWGGDFLNRMYFPLSVVSRIREQVGDDFLLIFRLSMLDLVEKGNTKSEVELFAKNLEQAGVDVINTGIGWHESRIPTIGSCVPRAGFSWVTERFKSAVGIPLITGNRINTPEVAEIVLSTGQADMVSMARPFLADPNWVNKAKKGDRKNLNVCVACNQACLDRVFVGKRASCLVNPFACRETEWSIVPVQQKRRIAIVGAGPAGLACAVTAAERGLVVDLFEKANAIGGQLALAALIPGKSEFNETLRYFNHRLHATGVNLYLNHTATSEQLKEYDEVVIATGVKPFMPSISGAEDDPRVMDYQTFLRAKNRPKSDVAVIGAGGIGVDVAIFLAEKKDDTVKSWIARWGIDTSLTESGGLKPASVSIETALPLWLLQRKKGRVGKGLGKTTGWAHRSMLQQKGVQLLDDVQYRSWQPDQGLMIRRGNEDLVLPVKFLVICAGQQSENHLLSQLQGHDVKLHCIGGAKEIENMDAEQAIYMGTKLALTL